MGRVYGGMEVYWIALMARSAIRSMEDMSGVSPDMGLGVGASKKGQEWVEFMVVWRCTG